MLFPSTRMRLYRGFPSGKKCNLPIELTVSNTRSRNRVQRTFLPINNRRQRGTGRLATDPIAVVSTGDSCSTSAVFPQRTGLASLLGQRGFSFNVLFMNDAQMAGTGAVGFCDPETQTIGLVGSQPNDSMQDTFLHGLEQQPCGVQVVEWVGLVAKYFSDHYDSSSKTY